jgi:hypothetical protein
VTREVKANAAGVMIALLALAVLSSRASPGFPLAEMPKAVGKAVVQALSGARDLGAGRRPTVVASQEGASAFALADIPPSYRTLYVGAGRTCPALRWQVLAGIGKVETDHGRSSAPGVLSGVNSAGCCAGPMQFNLRNGPPSTWDTWGRGNVYDPADAIPAAARKLCGDGLANPQQVQADPCPTVHGSPALHRALLRYNNACWYVHEVVTLAERYSGSADSRGSGGSAPSVAASADPFVVALAHNPNITTTSEHGCQPGPDLASGRLDLRVQSLLAVVAADHRIRLSCLHTGHSQFVKGTTRVSNHTVWRAVDIDQVDGQAVSPASQAARGLVEWLDGLQGPLRPVEIGSPFDLGRRPYFTDEGHKGHIHVGYGSER